MAHGNPNFNVLEINLAHGAEIWKETEIQPQRLERFGSPAIEAGFSRDGESRLLVLKRERVGEEFAGHVD